MHEHIKDKMDFHYKKLKIIKWKIVSRPKQWKIIIWLKIHRKFAQCNSPLKEGNNIINDAKKRLTTKGTPTHRFQVFHVVVLTNTAEAWNVLKVTCQVLAAVWVWTEVTAV